MVAAIKYMQQRIINEGKQVPMLPARVSGSGSGLGLCVCVVVCVWVWVWACVCLLGVEIDSE